MDQTEERIRLLEEAVLDIYKYSRQLKEAIIVQSNLFVEAAKIIEGHGREIRNLRRENRALVNKLNLQKLPVFHTSN